MKRLLCLLVIAMPLAAQSASPPAPPSSDLKAEAAQLAEMAKRVHEEIVKMNKWELSVQAVRKAAEAEALTRKMRAQAGPPTQH